MIYFKKGRQWRPHQTRPRRRRRHHWRGSELFDGASGLVINVVNFIHHHYYIAAIYKAGIAYRQTSGDAIEVTIKGDEKEAKELKEKGIEDDEIERHESVDGDDQGNRRSRKKKKSSKVLYLIQY